MVEEKKKRHRPKVVTAEGVETSREKIMGMWASSNSGHRPWMSLN